MGRCCWVLWLIALLFGSAGCNLSSPKEPIPIGHVAPLSGAERNQGEQAQHGILVAVEEANAVEKPPMPWRFVVYHADSRGEPEFAQDQAVRLIALRKVVGLLGGTGAASIERVARGVQPYGVPLVVNGELPAPLTGDFLFSTTASPTYQGRMLARFALEELKATRAAVLADAGSALHATLADAFAKEFRSAKDVHLSRWDFGDKDDFAEVIGRLEKDKPGALVLAGAVRHLSRLRERLQSAKLATPLLFGAAEGSLAALQQPQGSDVPVFVTTVFAEEGLTSTGQEFARKFRERFGPPLDLQAALAYDGARLLFDALMRARTTSGTRPREELAKTEGFESLTGPLTFGPDHYARRPVFVLRLDKGERKLARRFDAEPKE